MTLRNRISRALRRFRKDEGGSIAVETIMMVPLLAWAMLSTLAYFDAYRSESITTKSSLTIADMFSRETDLITAEYVTNAQKLLKFLTLGDDDPDLRVTIVKWDDTNKKLELIWSQERGPRDALSSAEVAELAGDLPNLVDEERLILVETWIEYSPKFSVGLAPFSMATFDFISPRFVPQMCYKETVTADDSTMLC